MNLKKGTIYNTPLNPLFRQRRICLRHDKRGVIKKILYKEGSFGRKFSQEGSF